MTGYTKLFHSILASTIWREDDKTRIVWITLLAMANKYGVAEGSIPGLADMARVSIEDCEAALAKLEGPDKYSRTKENDGRRIEPVDGGWLLLNHAKYRAKMNQDDRREYNRLKQAEHRAKIQARGQLCQNPVSKRQQMSALSAQSEAEAEAEAEAEESSPEGISKGVQGESFRLEAMAPAGAAAPRRFIPPTDEEARSQGTSIGLPETEVAKFTAFYGSKGWKVGKSPMKDWRRAMWGWKLRWDEAGGANHPATHAPNGQIPAWKVQKAAEDRIQALTDQARLMPDGPPRTAILAEITKLKEKTTITP